MTNHVTNNVTKNYYDRAPSSMAQQAVQNPFSGSEPRRRIPRLDRINEAWTDEEEERVAAPEPSPSGWDEFG